MTDPGSITIVPPSNRPLNLEALEAVSGRAHSRDMPAYAMNREVSDRSHPVPEASAPAAAATDPREDERGGTDAESESDGADSANNTDSADGAA